MKVTIEFKGKTYARPSLSDLGSIRYEAKAAMADGSWSSRGGMSHCSDRPNLRTAMGMNDSTDAEFLTAVESIDNAGGREDVRLVLANIEKEIFDARAEVVRIKETIADNIMRVENGNTGSERNKIDALEAYLGKIRFLEKVVDLLFKENSLLDKMTFLSVTMIACDLCDSDKPSWTYGVTRALKYLTFDFTDK